MEYFVECNDVIKIYEGEFTQLKVAALRGIDLEIKKNTLTALSGPSGSGKSTLFNLLGGMESPSAGRIRVGNKQLTSLSDRELMYYRKNFVSYIFQDPRKNLIWNLSVQKNIQIPMKISGKTLEIQNKKVKELAKTVGISHRLKHNPSKLSGGEAQRASIASALAKNPKLVLADEPTGELDSKNAQGIALLFKDIKDHHDATSLIATHDMRLSKNCDSVVFIRDGRVVGIEENRRIGRREYYTFIDRFGQVRLPDRFLSNLQIKNRVKIKQKDENGNFLEIIDVGDLSE
ncbi:MAG: ABC transporter ATP-binding protein [Candidatus Hodarchaeales archaeon]|jgi:ABC-type lipoprotein export system ATPase subunit